MKKVIFTLFVTFSLALYAQQTPQSNTYIYNPFSINPAYAGASGCTEVNFSHLNQWVKVEGAPLTSNLNVNTLLGKSFGLGGTILIDKIGMLQQFSGSVSASYGLTFAQEHRLRFGLSAGYNQYRIDPEGAIYFDLQDPIVNGGVQSAGTINTEFGVLYQWKGLDVAVASKQLIQTYSNFGYSGLDGYGLRRHLSGLVAYRHAFNPSWSIKPSVFMRGINTGMQFDFNADAQYKGFIDAGLGYRTNVGLIARLGINVQKLFFIGYAYESPMRNIASYSTGSHQVVLGLKFCKKKDEPVEEIVELKKEEIQDSLPEVQDSIKVKDIAEVPDTVYISKVDTVFIGEKKTISDNLVKEALMNVERSLYFEFDGDQILLKSFKSLQSLVDILKVREDVMLEVEGHTDDRASAEYNLKLSEKRASSVKKYLVDNGVSSDRVKVSFYGETKPVASNDSSAGRQMNRRVRIKIISKN